jgi:hypothetical protein
MLFTILSILFAFGVFAVVAFKGTAIIIFLCKAINLFNRRSCCGAGGGISSI